MDFEDTPEEAAFRAEVRGWIDANAPKDLAPELKTRRLRQRSASESVDPLAAAKAWQKTQGRRRAGPACTGRRSTAAAAATPIERVIWGQEEGVYGALASPFIIGHGMCGPTVMAWAAEEQKRALPAAAGRGRGDLVPAVLRAGRRLGPRGPAHPRRAGQGRLRRLDRQRPEDLDQRRPAVRIAAC